MFMCHRFVAPISIPDAHLRGSPLIQRTQQLPSPFPFQKKRWRERQPSLPVPSAAKGWAVEFPFTRETGTAISRALGFTRDANNQI